MMMIYNTNKARSRVKTSLTIVLKTKNKEGIGNSVCRLSCDCLVRERPETRTDTSALRLQLTLISHLSSKEEQKRRPPPSRYQQVLQLLYYQAPRTSRTCAWYFYNHRTILILHSSITEFAFSPVGTKRRWIYIIITYITIVELIFSVG